MLRYPAASHKTQDRVHPKRTLIGRRWDVGGILDPRLRIKSCSPELAVGGG